MWNSPNLLLDPNNRNHSVPDSKLFVTFSIPRNWNSLMAEEKTQLAKDLQCLHGFRFQMSIQVIMAHCVLAFYMLPIENPLESQEVCVISMQLADIILNLKIPELLQLFHCCDWLHSFLLHINRNPSDNTLHGWNGKWQRCAQLPLLLERYHRPICENSSSLWLRYIIAGQHHILEMGRRSYLAEVYQSWFGNLPQELVD